MDWHPVPGNERYAQASGIYIVAKYRTVQGWVYVLWEGGRRVSQHGSAAEAMASAQEASHD